MFVPHDKGAPAVTDAGGVRAVSIAPKIELLAPEQMARTLSPTPTLYWHISKAAPGKVRFTLIADDPAAIDPLLEIDIDGVDQEGIYGVSLDDHGIALESGEALHLVDRPFRRWRRPFERSGRPDRDGTRRRS